MRASCGFTSRGCPPRRRVRNGRWRMRHEFMKIQGSKYELWRGVPGFDDVFASSCGLVRRRFRGTDTWRIDSGSPNREDDGYLHVFINDRSYAVHRLVAATFHNNPASLPHVNHIDGVKTNNDASNLEWCTPYYNSHHAVNMGLATFGRIGTQNGGGGKLTDESVTALFSDVSCGAITKSAAARKYGVSPSMVGAIMSRKAWRHLPLGLTA